MRAVIETHALTKAYGESRGIHEVSLAVDQGEVFGFLGPNGAGKTTTIRTLLDLQRPTSGEARIFGLDSRRESAAIRARSGNLSGDFDFDPKLTGREMLEHMAALRGMRDLGSAEPLAQRFEADLSRPLGDLSRGNRQKVGLINAFFHVPELLILDEPTSGFDPLMQEEFLALVREQREAGRTVFLSSDDLGVRALLRRCRAGRVWMTFARYASDIQDDTHAHPRDRRAGSGAVVARGVRELRRLREAGSSVAVPPS